ncbi:MAG: hypothetical protein JWQ02_826 [Capsulimonas sp.]|nr:hypothetical protein [Capsulimonas sp.]
MTAAEYRALVVKFRKSQLQLTAEGVNRLEEIFDAAVDSILEKIQAHGDESLSQVTLSALLESIQAELVNLRSDTVTALDAGMLSLAQNAADREAETAALLGEAADPRLAAASITHAELSSGKAMTVRFGRLARSAVERVAHKVFSDGLKLSDRLYNLDTEAKKVIGDTLIQGVAEQISARDLAKRLQGTLSAAGADNPRYKAMRIARTEINNAHREAHIQSTKDAEGNLKEYITGVGWRLSYSHKLADVCDIWASDDSGLGPGNYLPDDIPSEHPHGLCFTVTLLAALPDAKFPGKAPTPADVPESEGRYSARNGDPAAQRWMDQYGSNTNDDED